MALPTSGVISASMIKDELKESGSFSLNSNSSRNLAGVYKGAIKFSDFYGKSADNETEFTITGINKVGLVEEYGYTDINCHIDNIRCPSMFTEGMTIHGIGHRNATYGGNYYIEQLGLGPLLNGNPDYYEYEVYNNETNELISSGRIKYYSGSFRWVFYQKDYGSGYNDNPIGESLLLPYEEYDNVPVRIKFKAITGT